MKSLQLKNIQVQINSLINNSKLFPNNIKKINENEYFINLTIIPENFEILKNVFNNKIEFILYLGHNYPLNPPKIYILNKFNEKCFLCDCRDLLYEIINKNIWKNNQYNLIDIVSLIPEFLLKISNENYKKKEIGNYYLDDEYNYYLINSTEKLYYGEITEQIMINNNNIYEKKNIFISEEYILLFTLNNEFNNFILNQLNQLNTKINLKLIFYANFKSIDYIKRLNSTIQINFKIKNHKIYKFQFISNESELIFNIIMNMLQKNNINYSVNLKISDNNKANINKKEAEEIEEKIVKLERKLSKDNFLEVKEINNLIEYYEIIKNYYNFQKDKREEEYKIKLNKIKNNEIIKNILNNEIKTQKNIIKNNQKEINKENNNNKEINNDNNQEPNKINNNDETINNNKIEENNINNKLETNNNKIENINENLIQNDKNLENKKNDNENEIEKNNQKNNNKIKNQNNNNDLKKEEEKNNYNETIKMNINKKNDLNLNFDDED